MKCEIKASHLASLTPLPPSKGGKQKALFGVELESGLFCCGAVVEFGLILGGNRNDDSYT